MSEAPIVKSNAEEKVKELEARIHAMEIEKRVEKIHSKNPKFNPEGKSLDYLDGYAQCLADFPVTPPKQHSVAETVPAQTIAKHGRKIGEPIDEDELIKDVGESDP